MYLPCKNFQVRNVVVTAHYLCKKICHNIPTFIENTQCYQIFGHEYLIN